LGLKSGQLHLIFETGSMSGVITPRSEIIAVKVGMMRTEVIQTFVQAGHSRLPLYEDSQETIVGVLHAKDVLQTFLADHTYPGFGGVITSSPNAVNSPLVKPTGMCS